PAPWPRVMVGCSSSGSLGEEEDGQIGDAQEPWSLHASSLSPRGRSVGSDYFGITELRGIPKNVRAESKRRRLRVIALRRPSRPANRKQVLVERSQLAAAISTRFA